MCGRFCLCVSKSRYSIKYFFYSTSRHTNQFSLTIFFQIHAVCYTMMFRWTAGLNNTFKISTLTRMPLRHLHNECLHYPRKLYFLASIIWQPLEFMILQSFTHASIKCKLNCESEFLSKNFYLREISIRIDNFFFIFVNSVYTLIKIWKISNIILYNLLIIKI